MYDSFSQEYDYFVNWKSRLDVELPFIEGWLSQIDRDAAAERVLDAACGTGMHAIALAKRGYSVSGADISAAMIDKARQNAADAGVDLRFEAAGFSELADTFGLGGFDAMLCLGNSLPHILTPEELASALNNFAACLRPGGLLLIQNRNFDTVMANGERWMEPQSHREGQIERVFLRFYDFEPAGLISFNIITLRREGSGDWVQEVKSTRLRPQRQAELVAALTRAGFANIQSFGNMEGAPFNLSSSGNLVITAVYSP